MKDSYDVDQIIDAVSELIDIEALTSGVDFENSTIDFEIAKMLIIQQTLPMILNILADEKLNSHDKIVALVSSMSFVCLENFYLHTSLKQRSNENN